jgi:hypothetical protein
MAELFARRYSAIKLKMSEGKGNEKRKSLRYHQNCRGIKKITEFDGPFCKGNFLIRGRP